MLSYGIVSCPSALGLWPSGVQTLGQTLLDHGLALRLSAPVAPEVLPGPYRRVKDSVTGYLNGPAIRDHALRTAEAVAEVRATGRIPIVLGGDCSVVIGPVLALRRTATPGLFYLDGHQDFYDGAGDQSGEVADMALGILTGNAHPLLSDIDGLSPYVPPSRAVAFGFRDEQAIAAENVRSLDGTGIMALGLAGLRRTGLDAGLAQACARLAPSNSDAVWVHFDADVIDDALNPAVDYTQPGGLSWLDVARVLRALRGCTAFAGLSASIFNPRKDHDGRIAMALTECLVAGLRD